MLSKQRLSSLLALAALLVGNLAGWAHVGSHAGGSCGHAHPERTETASTETAPTCCDHAQQCDADDARPAEDAVPEDTEHDADHCLICQHFLASRYVLLSCDEGLFWTPVTVVGEHLLESAIPLEPLFLSGLSSRGPPCS